MQNSHTNAIKKTAKHGEPKRPTLITATLSFHALVMGDSDADSGSLSGGVSCSPVRRDSSRQISCLSVMLRPREFQSQNRACRKLQTNVCPGEKESCASQELPVLNRTTNPIQGDRKGAFKNEVTRLNRESIHLDWIGGSQSFLQEFKVPNKQCVS